VTFLTNNIYAILCWIWKKWIVLTVISEELSLVASMSTGTTCLFDVVGSSSRRRTLALHGLTHDIPTIIREMKDNI
jgi:hypothetical protein